MVGHGRSKLLMLAPAFILVTAGLCRAGVGVDDRRVVVAPAACMRRFFFHKSVDGVPLLQIAAAYPDQLYRILARCLVAQEPACYMPH